MRRPPLTLLALLLVAGLLLGLAPAPPATACAPRPAFDLQAHRGGLGLTVENTIPSFSRALRLGVITLELDVPITEDGRAVVTHDRQISGTKCRDTALYTPGDPEFPTSASTSTPSPSPRSGSSTAAPRPWPAGPGNSRTRAPGCRS